MNNKERLRIATLGQPTNFKKEIVEINGEKFEVRQPSIAARAELRIKCMDTDNFGKPQFNSFKFMLWSVIANTFVPDTNDKVFEDTDYDVLISQPSGGFVDTLTEAAMRMSNVEVSSAKKSSETIQKDS